jgi:polyisoprenoid-binding protein YceI
MSTQTPTTELTSLPVGVWHVDTAKSTLAFKARGMFGLVPANGTFSEYEGTLTVDDAGAHGELHITAASLDTGNAKRDEHLRSADFFDVEQHPTVVFTLKSVSTDGPAGLKLTGTLAIAQNRLEFTAPVTAKLPSDDRLVLSSSVSVERSSAGVGWSKFGMIQGKAHLNGTIELIRDV